MVPAQWQTTANATWYSSGTAVTSPIQVGVAVAAPAPESVVEESPLEWLDRRVEEVCELVR